MELLLNILKAHSGDSFLITYIGTDTKKHYILIDGGIKSSYDYSIKQAISNIDKIDYTFITHIDRDHIGGILKLLNTENHHKLKNLFFNSGHIIKISGTNLISENDGIELITKINELKTININKKEITTDTIIESFGLKISFLSPTLNEINNFNKTYTLPKIDEDLLISNSCMVKSITNLKELSEKKFSEKNIELDPANAVSLAMLLEYNEKKILLLGDAKDNVIIPQLKKTYNSENKLKLDFIKLSHHGSKFHTSNEFLSLIECSNFIISTNGKYNHPTIEVLARILCHKNRQEKQKIKFYLNYSKDTYEHIPFSEIEDEYNCVFIFEQKDIKV